MGTVHNIKNLTEGAVPQKKKRLSPRQRRKQQVFEESLEGLSNKIQSGGSKKGKLDRALGHVREFQAYTNKSPWEWTRDDFEGFSAHLAKDLGNKGGSQRMKQLDINQYMSFLMVSRFNRIIETEFGVVLKPICDADNMIIHKVENDNATKRRNLTPEELNRFFDSLDDYIMILQRLGGKGFLPAQRDKTLYGVMAMMGVRDNEIRHINIDDIHPNPDHPEFGKFGRIEIWFGKSTKGSNYKHRTVWVTDMQCVKLLEWYVTEVRPHFINAKTREEDINALFFSERHRRIGNRAIQVNFKNYLKDFNMYEMGLVPHSLRRSFATNETEDEHTSPHLVQKQMGHEFLSTTQHYTDLSDPFFKKALDDTIKRKLDKYDERDDDEK